MDLCGNDSFLHKHSFLISSRWVKIWSNFRHGMSTTSAGSRETFFWLVPPTIPIVQCTAETPGCYVFKPVYKIIVRLRHLPVSVGVVDQSQRRREDG